MTARIAQARKLAVHVVGLLALVVGANVLPAHWQALGLSLIGLASTYGLYRVPNAPAPELQSTADLSLNLGPTIT